MSDDVNKMARSGGNGCCGECERCTEKPVCGGCSGNGCPGATASGCGGGCPHAAGNEYEWDYDDTVLVFSSDMLEESP